MPAGTNTNGMRRLVTMLCAVVALCAVPASAQTVIQDPDLPPNGTSKAVYYTAGDFDGDGLFDAVRATTVQEGLVDVFPGQAEGYNQKLWMRS